MSWLTLELCLGICLLCLPGHLLARPKIARFKFVALIGASAPARLIVTGLMRIFGFFILLWATLLFAGSGNSDALNWLGLRFLVDWRDRGLALVESTPTPDD